VRVTSPPVGYGDTDPNVSPDGRTLAFVRLSKGSEDGDLHSLVIIRADGTHPVTIMSIPGFSPHFIAWGLAPSQP
jgi:Tol biopolymer transport system component